MCIIPLIYYIMELTIQYSFFIIFINFVGFAYLIVIIISFVIHLSFYLLVTSPMIILIH